MPARDPQEIDPNFALPELEGEWEWQDANAWPIHAQGWTGGIGTWGRLPDAAEGIVTENVWVLSRHSAGLYYEFTTDSPQVAVQWHLLNPQLEMDHMPATGVSGLDAYQWDGSSWRMIGVGRPTAQVNRVILVSHAASSGAYRLRTYLPLYNGLTALRFGMRPGSSLDVHPPTRAPVCVYGTSIVQGGCASRPGMAYPAILGRKLDRPFINLGFSGNGKAEPCLADLLAEIRPAAIVVDCLPNLGDHVVARKNLSEFVPRLLRATGEIPVVFVGHLLTTMTTWKPEVCQKIKTLDGILAAILARHEQEFPGRIHWKPGEDLLGTDGEATVDGVHPTDLGFQRMADALERPLRKILKELRGSG